MLKRKMAAPAATPTEHLDHQRLVALINSMSDGVIALSPLFYVVLANGAMLDILDLNSINGQLLPDILKITDKSGGPLDPVKLIMQNPSGYTSRDVRLRYEDGSSINIFISITPVQGSYGSTQSGGFVIIIRDITREKLVEEERDEFVSVAGHELRTPVTIAEGSISNAILLASKAQVSEAVIQTLESAHSQVVFLSTMINDLAMLSRAERGKVALEIEIIDVAELVEAVANDYQSQAAKKGLELKVETVGVKKLISSRLYVREILQNFITNSLKYTEKGQISLQASVENGGVLFIVSDTGFGISQSEQKKLFTKFFRSEDSRVKKEHGTGLGLYVTGKLVRLLEGKLEITSELNKGTTFKLHIPNLSLPENIRS